MNSRFLFVERLALAAFAAFLVLVSLAGPSATAAADPAPPAAAGTPAVREYIYGAELMTPAEREAYRKRMRGARSAAERQQVGEQHRHRLRERARGQGRTLQEPAGVLAPAEPAQ
jgi:hypothetical protein